MLDQNDLQAIAQLIKDGETRLAANWKSDLANTEQRIPQNTTALMDAQFSQRFDLLAEGQQIILEKLERLEDMDILDTRISALEAMVKKLNREINQLKKAQ